jgi:hypothetical protein
LIRPPEPSAFALELPRAPAVPPIVTTNLTEDIIDD